MNYGYPTQFRSDFVEPIGYTKEEREKKEKKEAEEERLKKGLPKKTKGYTSNKVISTLDDNTYLQLKRYSEDVGLPFATAIRNIIIDFLIENKYRRKRIVKDY
jgi:hypothetical protein